MRYIALCFALIFLTISVEAKHKGAPPMSAGAPGDRTCQTSKCHAGNPLNSDQAQILIEGLPQTYTANEIYSITLSLKQSGAKKWGFIATAADSNGQAAGRLETIKGQHTQLWDNTRYRSRTDRQYITHTAQGIKGPRKAESPHWTFNWQAPDSTTGPATLYFAFNAANGNKKKTGDYIYTRSTEILPTQ